MSYQNNNGSLNKNEEKNCLSGSVNVEGKEYFIDVYPRQNPDGSKWYKVMLKLKDKQSNIQLDF